MAAMTPEQVDELRALVHAKDQDGLEAFVLQFTEVPVAEMLQVFGLIIRAIEDEPDEDAREFWTNNDSPGRREISIHKVIRVGEDGDDIDEVVEQVQRMIASELLPHLVDDDGTPPHIAQVYTGPDDLAGAVPVTCIRCERSGLALREQVPDDAIGPDGTATALCAVCVLLAHQENKANET